MGFTDIFDHIWTLEEATHLLLAPATPQKSSVETALLLHPPESIWETVPTCNYCGPAALVLTLQPDPFDTDQLHRAASALGPSVLALMDGDPEVSDGDT